MTTVTLRRGIGSESPVGMLISNPRFPTSAPVPEKGNGMSHNIPRPTAPVAILGHTLPTDRSCKVGPLATHNLPCLSGQGHHLHEPTEVYVRRRFLVVANTSINLRSAALRRALQHGCSSPYMRQSSTTVTLKTNKAPSAYATNGYDAPNLRSAMSHLS